MTGALTWWAIGLAGTALLLSGALLVWEDDELLLTEDMKI